MCFPWAHPVKTAAPCSIGQTSAPVLELHQHSSHVNHSRLLHQNRFVFFFKMLTIVAQTGDINTRRLWTWKPSSARVWLWALISLFPASLHSRSNTSGISLAGAQGRPFKCHIRSLFFSLWLITACFKCCFTSSSCLALCSPCPRVIAGHCPLCTIYHLITDRNTSVVVVVGSRACTLMSNGTDVWKPTSGVIWSVTHCCLEVWMSQLLFTADSSVLLEQLFYFISFIFRRNHIRLCISNDLNIIYQ